MRDEKDRRRRNRKAKDTRRRLAAHDGHIVSIVGPAACCAAELEIAAGGGWTLHHDDDCVILTDPGSPEGTAARVRMNAAVNHEVQRVTGVRMMSLVEDADGGMLPVYDSMPGLRMQSFEASRAPETGPFAAAVARITGAVQAGTFTQCGHLTGDSQAIALLGTGALVCLDCLPIVAAEHVAAHPDTCDACGLAPPDGRFSEVFTMVAANLHIGGNICGACVDAG